MSHTEHRESAPLTLRIAVLTVSDTRTEADDTSGRLIRELCVAAGHAIAHSQIVADDLDRIRRAVEVGSHDPTIEAIIITGGTGVGPRDVTVEAITPLIDKELPGFGELFRMLSWQEIGAAAYASRAMAGVAGGTVVFALPGSQAAVRLALERLVLPEVAHLVGEVIGRRRHRHGHGAASSR